MENSVESEAQQMSLPSWKGERGPVTFMKHVDGLAQWDRESSKRSICSCEYIWHSILHMLLLAEGHVANYIHCMVCLAIHHLWLVLPPQKTTQDWTVWVYQGITIMYTCTVGDKYVHPTMQERHQSVYINTTVWPTFLQKPVPHEYGVTTQTVIHWKHNWGLCEEVGYFLRWSQLLHVEWSRFSTYLCTEKVQTRTI